MPLELFIAFRYLKARRRGVFTLLTTVIAIGGIMLGVAALIITLAVMSGFHRDIREKILGIQPHLIVLKDSSERFSEFESIAEKLKKNREITAVSPFVYGQIILRNRHATSGAVVKGVDFRAEDTLVHLKRTMSNEHLDDFQLGDHDIILGKELSRNLRIRPGDEVILVSPGELTMIPRMEKFKVTATFQSGMYEYDANLAYISLASGQRLFEMGGSVTGLGVSINNWEQASQLEKSLQRTLSYPYMVRSWQNMNRNLFAALKLEKIMMFIILTLIILVAAFNIISNLLLLTVEKGKEIGILSALGLPRLKIARIFFFEGLIIGCSGIFMGLLSGLGISLLLKKYRFIQLPADVYYIDTLPIRIVPTDVLWVVAATLIITLLAGIYPSYQVTKLDPLEAIRYG